MTNDDLICNGPITRQHLEEILQNYFKTKTKLVKAEGQIISEGMGFTSDVMRVKLEWEVKDDLPLKVIAKAPRKESVAKFNENFGGGTDQKAKDASAATVLTIHENECKAYEMFKDEHPIPLPKIYGFWLMANEKNHPGLIVLEDIGDRAVIAENIAKGLSFGQWRSIVETLADLHAWSLSTDKWKENVSDVAINSSMKDFFQYLCKNASTSIKTVKEKYQDYFGHVDEEKIIERMNFDLMMDSLLLHRKFMPDVLLHGDTSINNFMFEKNADGTAGDKVAALIDWQICLQGSCVYDFVRLEIFFINHELRRANGTKMLKIYYDRLKSKSGDKISLTFDQLEHLYRDALAATGLLGPFVVDHILHNIAKSDADETGWRRKECLTRLKAGYDDAAMYYGWSTVA